MRRRPSELTPIPYTTLFRSIAGLRWNDRAVLHARQRHDGLDRRAHHGAGGRSEEHTSELQALRHLVCRLLLEQKKTSSPTSRTLSRPRTSTATCLTPLTGFA